MKRRALSTRILALAAMVTMPWAVTGPGVHDPDCPHHQPGAIGAAHAGGGMEHGAGHGHGHGAEEGSGHGSGSGRDCRCLGPCILGAHAGPPVPAGAPADGIAAAPARAHAVHRSGFLPWGPAAFHLPFATGPPRRA